ncbi:3-hydroxyisobutyryl-CoA hydrolase [Mycoemilia scoparia]|uniref:3-hydroxyisobutyryl-CoA hydrolase n=1 Tax=Mycoemilia scoparia TaxID=417184 RepID=A0A9W8DRW5_9FUNG|nr:3-hydroxyisobutyryl-CoA hydrolase [Mycoemilia scoparia]
MFYRAGRAALLTSPLVSANRLPVYGLASTNSKLLFRNMATAPSSASNNNNNNNEVIAHQEFGTRTLILNRPKALNALNRNMINIITNKLKEWKGSDLCSLVVLKSNSPKAFCAGGDVVQVSKLAKARDPQAAAFFNEEYTMDHFIATYNKPIVSLISGITMGGGVGITFPTPFRVATETTMFAMPETQIGFFPDVAASYFLPKLDGQLGKYLGLTGARLNGIDVFYSGIATHFVPTERIPLLEKRLQDIETPNYDAVNKVIEEFVEQPSSSPGNGQSQFSLAPLRDSIDRCFGKQTIEEIYQALEEESKVQPEWAQSTIKLLNRMSPTSLKITLEMLQTFNKMSLKRCYAAEYQLAQKFLNNHDVHEGISEQLITKSRNPKWNPPTLGEVSLDSIRKEYFSNPSKLSVDFINKDKDHPSVELFKYALPSEDKIKRVVKGDILNSSGQKLTTRDEIVGYFELSKGFKIGVAEKVNEVLDRKCVEESNPNGGGPSVLVWKDY